MITDLYVGLRCGAAGGALVVFGGCYRMANGPLYLVAAGEFEEFNNSPSISQFLVPIITRLRSDCAESGIQLDINQLKVRFCSASPVARESIKARCETLYEAWRLDGHLDSLSRLVSRQQGVSIPTPIFRRNELKGDDMTVASRTLTDLITSGRLLAVGDAGAMGAQAIADAAVMEWDNDRPPLLIDAACHAIVPWAFRWDSDTERYIYKLKRWFPNLSSAPDEVVELPASLGF